MEKIQMTEEQAREMLEALTDLLIDSINLYEHYPNNFRGTWKEYFKNEITIIERATGLSIEEVLEATE